MYVLRIEHSVPNFQRWKEAFDSDPVDRKKMGVSRYRVLRAIDDPSVVMIDLEFEKRPQAEVMLSALNAMWSRVKGSVMTDPSVRIVEQVEDMVP